MKYTEDEIEFLKENYPKYGSSYCKNFLRGRSTSAITATANRIGLRIQNKSTHPSMEKVDMSKFYNIVDEHVAYFLGYMWSDGYIRQYTSNSTLNSKVSLEICADDAEKILPIMNSITDWSIHKRKRKDSWKETWTFSKNNLKLYSFLEENDFRYKSNEEPSKILFRIPNNLNNYFWKGVIDGDGSIGFCGKNCYFEIAGTYDYKYSEVIKKFTELGITKYSIYKSISKRGHKSSVIKIYGKEILKLKPLFLEYGLIVHLLMSN